MPLSLSGTGVEQADLASNVAGNGPAFSAYLSANVALSAGVTTKVPYNAEEYDTHGAFDSTTNRRFQPTVAGYYQINVSVWFDGTGTTAGALYVVYLYKNGAAYKSNLYRFVGNGDEGGSIVSLVYMNGSTDYLEAFVLSNSATNLRGSSSSPTYMNGFLARAA